MARKTKEESQKTRDGILDAAERVFLEKGVGTTAMADLADAAGVSRGAVYGHYKNKRAVERGELPARLDVELASIYLQSLWDGICGTLAWTERLRDDPWNRAERMFRAGLDSLRSSPYLLLADA
ncbi:TetR family transcriptional regulator [Pseudomonas aeruginosa]|uniref:TetR family transcriptional regulator n=1 Tax=Pseudomonas aeruginosa TaxID=287 RepID=UPI00106835E4|nr:TetR family transcriptional regulator [Pseudomonas aeruginosa]TEM58333.1 TetR family transcriptional regulator [Pseudomonas aeruginosa]TEM59674.1 TetR family transcriptional regulator [Pseudomonas aeruginosa]TEM67180.1 TetR family transcriptional regulator [Pseudomonas aeruginosa]TEM75506.1 TetR family transcriptional regulator [Pseudomonas aeruginosa]TEM79693.1 TetR family transcriptional regulator [Pseudomonas aeruginosa]